MSHPSRHLADMENADASLLDRIEGTLVGAAVGDALGAPYEFEIPGPVAPVMRGGGIGPWEPGEWTDDTQQLVCVARAAATGDLQPDAVGAMLLAWYHGVPKDVGHQTRLVLSQAASAAALVEVALEVYASRPRSAAGNGALMRTAPVALAYLGDDDAIATAARAIASLTHADPLCGDACVLWCIAIDRAIRDGRVDGVDDGLEALPAVTRAGWRSWIEHARDEPPSTFVPNGFVVTAFQAALSAVVRSTSFADGVRLAIGAGHDTDTVGAIAGALLGARYGRDAIPQEWQRPLHGWPDLAAGDLAALARAIAEHAGRA